MIVDIIGAGIGGLTLGIALKQQGIHVRIFERAKEIKEVGAGIILANNAMQVYQQLGLDAKITAKGNVVSEIAITDEQLKAITRNSLVAFEERYQSQNIAIHRGVLQRILVAEFSEEELFLDHELVGINENGKQLVFANGKTVSTSVIIGADGIFSKVRELVFQPKEIRNAKQICWRGVVSYKLPADYAHMATECWGNASRFGFVQIKEGQVYWYALKNTQSESEELQKIDTKDFASYHPLCVDIIKKTDPNKIHTAIMKDIKPFNDWSVDTVCLLGDAAHATTPNLGQGACQAIEDAYVLASCLEKYSVTEAFKIYEQKRIKKAHKVVNVSWSLGKISQLPYKWARAVRNTFLRFVPASVNKKQVAFLFKIAE
ncbi:FAD-dependent monooxygenase [Wenyingzhuangia sp. IMCC45574]